MASSANGITNDSRSNIIDLTRLETEFKKDKAKAKSNFTRSRNKLLLLLEQQDMPSRRGVRDACQSMDTCMEIAMEVLSRFSEFYIEDKQIQKSQIVVSEMEKIEESYYTAYEAAQEYLVSRKDDKSSITSDIMSIEMLQSMNISGDQETYRKEEMLSSQQRTVQEVQTFNKNSNIYDYSPRTSANISSYPEHLTNNIELSSSIQRQRPTEPANIMTSNMTKSEQTFKDQDRYERPVTDSVMHPLANEARVIPHPVRLEPRENFAGPSIGQDLWRQLKRVEIPVFSGDKRAYQSWKSAFLACIDSAPATGEYKLLQLRQYLSGEALKVIENLGHSATAYEAAKDRLERKYGGKRRQIAIYLEDLEQFRQIRPGNAKDLEEFADLLDIGIINLKEAGQNQELGDGSLYTKLQRKLPQSMLARYHRWIFETNTKESVETLRAWIIQESEFQTIASETVYGLTGNIGDNQSSRLAPRFRNQAAYFGELKDNPSMQNLSSCQVCGNHHRIWNCREFCRRSVPDRWNIAKRFQLCYRCLGEGHSGKSCPRGRPCGQNGCRELHHKLLHNNACTSDASAQNLRPFSTEPKIAGGQIVRCPDSDNLPADPVTSGTEGKMPKPQTTMVTQDGCRSDVVALRTIPVVLKNGYRSLKVNALLDDASTKTYVNADIAAELGLQGKAENVTVNVLNGQAETFKTMPVYITLESLTGNVTMNVTAYTANRVTGNMSVFDWNGFKKRWPYLKNINFPRPSTRPIVDILIGLDCVDLHCAMEEVRGRPGEPIARLTPLGWTCIGHPGINYSDEVQHTNFTYFVCDQSQIGILSGSSKQLYKTEAASSHTETTPRVIVDDTSAIDNRNRRSISCIEAVPSLAANHEMTQRTGHTEQGLTKSQRIWREPAYKPFYSFLRRGSIVNRPLDSKYDRKLFSVPSTELHVARIAKNEVGKNDRTTEPSLKFASVLCSAICAQNQLGKNGAIAHQILSSCLQKKMGTYESDTMSMHALTGTSEHVGSPIVDVRWKLKTSLRLTAGTFGKFEKLIVNQTVTCHANPVVAQHLIGIYGSDIQSAKNANFSSLHKTDINVEVSKTSITGTEGQMITLPLTYLSASPAKGISLALNQHLHGQIRVQFAQPPVNATQCNLHGKEGVGSRNRSDTNSFMHLHNNGYWDDRRKWHKELRDRRVNEVVRSITRQLATRGVLEFYQGQDGRVQNTKTQVDRGPLVTSMTKLSLSIL